MFTNNTKKINRSYTIDKLLAERYIDSKTS